MLEKGSFSFVALLVINPVLILLFQNCSFAPVGQTQAHAESSQSRMVSSVGMMDKAAPGTKFHKNRPSLHKKSLAACSGKDLCPAAHIE